MQQNGVDVEDFAESAFNQGSRSMSDSFVVTDADQLEDFDAGESNVFSRTRAMKLNPHKSFNVGTPSRRKTKLPEDHFESDANNDFDFGEADFDPFNNEEEKDSMALSSHLQSRKLREEKTSSTTEEMSLDSSSLRDDDGKAHFAGAFTVTSRGRSSNVRSRSRGRARSQSMKRTGSFHSRGSTNDPTLRRSISRVKIRTKDGDAIDHEKAKELIQQHLAKKRHDAEKREKSPTKEDEDAGEEPAPLVASIFDKKISSDKVITAEDGSDSDDSSTTSSSSSSSETSSSSGSGEWTMGSSESDSDNDDESVEGVTSRPKLKEEPQNTGTATDGHEESGAIFPTSSVDRRKPPSPRKTKETSTGLLSTDAWMGTDTTELEKANPRERHSSKERPRRRHGDSTEEKRRHPEDERRRRSRHDSKDGRPPSRFRGDGKERRAPSRHRSHDGEYRYPSRHSDPSFSSERRASADGDRRRAPSRHHSDDGVRRLERQGSYDEKRIAPNSRRKSHTEDHRDSSRYRRDEADQSYRSERRVGRSRSERPYEADRRRGRSHDGEYKTNRMGGDDTQRDPSRHNERRKRQQPRESSRGRGEERDRERVNGTTRGESHSDGRSGGRRERSRDAEAGHRERLRESGTGSHEAESMRPVGRQRPESHDHRSSYRRKSKSQDDSDEKYVMAERERSSRVRNGQNEAGSVERTHREATYSDDKRGQHHSSRERDGRRSRTDHFGDRDRDRSRRERHYEGDRRGRSRDGERERDGVRGANSHRERSREDGHRRRQVQGRERHRESSRDGAIERDRERGSDVHRRGERQKSRDTETERDRLQGKSSDDRQKPLDGRSHSSERRPEHRHIGRSSGRQRGEGQAESPQLERAKEKPLIPATNSTSGSSIQFYKYEELRGKSIPSGVDRENKQNHLLPKDFPKVFGCSKDEFALMPRWKQQKMKRDAGLF